MKNQLHKLTALAVSKLSTPGYHNDGGGLYLQIKQNSSLTSRKSWIFRYKSKQKTRMMGLGPLYLVTLTEARNRAQACRKQLLDGVDPLEYRHQQQLQKQLEEQSRRTFTQCAEQYIEDNRAGWKNAKHAAQWTSTLQMYAYPFIGDKSVAQITTKMIVDLLRPIWVEKAETANRVRGRIQIILDWAKVQGFRTGDNPAVWTGHLDKILPARQKVSKTVHHAAMPYKELPAFMKELRARQGVSYRALEFAILNANRSGEVRLATWKEINFEEKLWIIPAERMKAAKEHRIPLSDESIALLKSLPGFMLDADLIKERTIFPSPRSQTALSDMALTTALKKLGQGEFTQHGFRSTFRDWAAEVVSYPREVIEHAIAHKLKDKVEAAYQRGDLLQKRRQLMAEWSVYCYQNKA